MSAVSTQKVDTLTGCIALLRGYSVKIAILFYLKLKKLGFKPIPRKRWTAYGVFFRWVDKVFKLRHFGPPLR